MDYLFPIILEGFSDSSAIGNVVEFLRVMGELTLPEIMCMLMPEVWENRRDIDQNIRDFYTFLYSIVIGVDGPAAIMVTDGDEAIGTLDANGLRPLRLSRHVNGAIYMGSEANVMDWKPREMNINTRLQPGEKVRIRLKTGELTLHKELMAELAGRHSYGEFVQALERCEVENKVPEDKAGISIAKELSGVPASEFAPLRVVTTAAGFSSEHHGILQNKLLEGGIPLIAMGDSNQYPLLRDLDRSPVRFAELMRELFAQVTNPPIDSLKEREIMSLWVMSGNRPMPTDAPKAMDGMLMVDSPVLGYDRARWFAEKTQPGFVYACMDKEETLLRNPINAILKQVDEYLDAGKRTIWVSDRLVNEGKVKLPTTLIVGAIHEHLKKRSVGNRTEVDIIEESADIITAHDVSVSLSNGASKVYPYATLGEIELMCRLEPSKVGSRSFEECASGYLTGLEKGLLKIMAKMGISRVTAYIGAREFELLLEDECADRYFGNTVKRYPSSKFGSAQIRQCYTRFHELAYEALAAAEGNTDELRLPNYGFYSIG